MNMIQRQHYSEQKLKERQQWYSLLTIVTEIELGLTFCALIFYFAVYLLTQLDILLQVTQLVVLHFVLTMVTLLFLIIRKNIESKRLEIATYLAIITWLLDIGLGTLLVGSSSGVVSMFFWAPVFAGILGLGVPVVVGVGVLTSAEVAVLISLQATKIVTPSYDVTKDLFFVNAFFWVIAISMLLAGLLVFRARLSSSIKESNARAEALGVANFKIEEFTRAGANISNRLTGTTAELKATSHQQVSGASEQAASIVQATSSLEELAETTRQIATNSGRVGQAASQSLVLAREVEAKSESVNQLTEQGLASVQGTISAVEAVRNRIEGLAQRLLVLTERSKEIGNIVELMRDIADETHMLALNAAIESADSKASSSNEGGGRRFGVIAGEVKNLADRSLESAQEVQKVIIEVQGAIATAVLTAEEGKKDTIKAVNQVYTSGEVIEQLGQAVGEAVRTSAKIVEVTNQVTALIEEITLATHQQTSASDQVIITMRNIGQVARESVNAISQTSAATAQIEQEAIRLNNILADANNLLTPNSEVASVEAK
jgi:methyl-accepting chemotaxis protein